MTLDLFSQKLSASLIYEIKTNLFLLITRKRYPVAISQTQICPLRQTLTIEDIVHFKCSTFWDKIQATIVSNVQTKVQLQFNCNRILTDVTANP